MSDFQNLNSWQPPTHTIRTTMLSSRKRTMPPTMLPSRILYPTLERAAYREYQHHLPHGEIWSESRNPVFAGKELHQQQEEDVVMSIARQYNYKRVPNMGSNGYDPRTEKARGFSYQNRRVWRELHAHCGFMSERARARIIIQMQKDFNFEAKGYNANEFNEYIEMVSWTFLDAISHNIELPEEFHNMLPDEQRKYFNDTVLPPNKDIHMPRMPLFFSSWSREQRELWYREYGEQCWRD